ncbi:MAG TPA: PIN domain-containing protein [Bacteroidales bacterium]|nr:PIN domain-containing protein [Bacteroidales bacterium]HRX97224.1 PIN domain-containing protein [Bacteroidales bacterium]
MIKVLLDTNIILDLLAKREPFYNGAARIFTLADKSKLMLFTTSLSIANTYYILSKLKSASDAREILRNFRVLVSIIGVDEKITDLSLNDHSFRDFEDAIQYYSALENNIGFIITRDSKGFKKSQIPVMTADEFLTSFLI